MNTQSRITATIEAKIIRKDGSVEELGVIGSSNITNPEQIERIKTLANK